MKMNLVSIYDIHWKVDFQWMLNEFSYSRLGFSANGPKSGPDPRLWSCLAPPMVVVTLPVGDQMHKRPALGLQAPGSPYLDEIFNRFWG